MSTASLSHTTIGSYRDQADTLLGKRLIIDGIVVPGSKDVDKITAATRTRGVYVVSQVDLYSHLIEGTPYYKRFNNNADRSKGETFTFMQARGMPAVSVVLDDDTTAIAVIKKMLSHEGKEVPWKVVLEQLGVTKSQKVDFLDTADSVDTTNPQSTVRLVNINGLGNFTVDKIESPNADIENLDSTWRLASSTRQIIAKVLPSLINQE